MRQAEGRDWRDGDWDCLMAPCHWASVLTGQDPGAPWRGTYDTPEEAAARLAAGGGMVRLVDVSLRALGWRRTRQPTPGAFGVITLPGEAERRGAVRFGRRWALPARAGMIVTEARMRAAWTHPLLIAATDRRVEAGPPPT